MSRACRHIVTIHTAATYHIHPPPLHRSLTYNVKNIFSRTIQFSSISDAFFRAQHKDAVLFIF